MGRMLTEPITEVIFVGLPGPTHHYGGLSPDNVASDTNRGSLSNPRQAALQVLDLMRLMRQMCLAVAVLPPQARPNMALLRQHFSGDDAAVIREAFKHAPDLLEKASSASAMWVANAATVAPSVDAQDGRLHMTVANLFTNLHRRIEAPDTFKVLRSIFDSVPEVTVHAPLSAIMNLLDEGAANHMRLCPSHHDRGLHVFVYGANGSARDPKSARQTLLASQAVAQNHHLPAAETLFIRQNPDVIEAGVFHNDVIAVGNENVLLVHKLAFENGQQDIDRITQAYRALHPGHELIVLIINEDDLSLDEAVRTYFFNSQIVTLPEGGMALIAPTEVELLYEGRALALMQRLRDDPNNPIRDIRTIDLRQSMRNGGGPACLRLRVPVNNAQLAALQTRGIMPDEALLTALAHVVERHYPDALTALDLGNPELYMRSQAALAEMGELLRLPLLD